MDYIEEFKGTLELTLVGNILTRTEIDNVVFLGNGNPSVLIEKGTGRMYNWLNIISLLKLK